MVATFGPTTQPKGTPVIAGIGIDSTITLRAIEFPGAEIRPHDIGESTPEAAEAFTEKRRRLALWQENVRTGIPNTPEVLTRSVNAGATPSEQGALASAQDSLASAHDSSSEIARLRSLLHTTEAARDEALATVARLEQAKTDAHNALDFLNVPRDCELASGSILTVCGRIQRFERDVFKPLDSRLSSLTQAHARLIEQWRKDARGTYMAGFYQTALDRCADDLARLGQASAPTTPSPRPPTLPLHAVR